MNRVTVKEIVKKTRSCAKKGKSWHFHILTPDCSLNDTDNFALILENTTDDVILVNYADKKQASVGKKLVELLHGYTVTEGKKKDVGIPESPVLGKMINRMEELNKMKVSWHHHMLFPSCVFNKNKGKWTLMFEDPETNNVIESVTEFEPKAGLEKIEPLFYAQEK